jgi:hypothetical protein
LHFFRFSYIFVSQNLHIPNIFCIFALDFRQKLIKSLVLYTTYIIPGASSRKTGGAASAEKGI